MDHRTRQPAIEVVSIRRDDRDPEDLAASAARRFADHGGGSPDRVFDDPILAG